MTNYEQRVINFRTSLPPKLSIDVLINDYKQAWVVSKEWRNRGARRIVKLQKK